MSKLLFLCSVVWFASVSLASAGCLPNWLQKDKADPAFALNRHLVDNEASDDLGANLVAARELLELLVTSDASGEKCNNEDKSLVEITKQFVALEKINDANMCQTESVKILSNLSDSLRAHGKDPYYEPESRRRLNSLVIGQANKHRQNCLPSLDSKWNELREKQPDSDLNSNKSLAYLSTLSDEIALDAFMLFLPSSYNEYSTKLIARTNERLIYVPIKNALVKAVRSEKNIGRLKEVDQVTGELVRTRQTVGKYLDEYLWKPCEWFTGSDLNRERAEIIQKTFKLLFSGEEYLDDKIYPGYRKSDLLKWTTNWSSCKRLLAIENKHDSVKYIHWSLNLGL